MDKTLGVLDALENRRSVRGFKPDPIDTATIRAILTIASRSPSFTNTQPWEVAVVTGATRDLLSQKLSELALANTPAQADMPPPTTWPQAAAERSKVHNINRFKHLGIGREDTEKRNQMRMQNYQFYGAPCALFIFMDEGFGPWSTMDVGGFTHSISLAAQAFGLATCMQASLAYYPDTVRQCLAIAPTKKLLVGMSVGLPDWQAPLNAYQSARMTLDEFVQWFD